MNDLSFHFTPYIDIIFLLKQNAPSLLLRFCLSNPHFLLLQKFPYLKPCKSYETAFALAEPAKPVKNGQNSSSSCRTAELYRSFALTREALFGSCLQLCWASAKATAKALISALICMLFYSAKAEFHSAFAETPEYLCISSHFLLKQKVTHWFL